MNQTIEKETNLKLNWLYLPWLGFALVCVVYTIIGTIVRGDPTPTIKDMGFANPPVFAMTLYVIGQVISVCILYGLLRKRGLRFDAVGVKGKLTLPAIGYALVGWILGFVIYYLVDLAMSGLGVPMYWGGKYTYSDLSSALEIILILVFAVLIGPLLEEIIFRGYVLTMFRERGWRISSAVLLSILIFTSVHAFFGPGVMVFIFIWSFIPTYLYLKFGNLYPAMLFHVLNNLVAYLVFPLFLPSAT